MSDRSHAALEAEISELKIRLAEAHDTLEAIRTGQVDAVVVNTNDTHALYTLKSADLSYRLFIEKMTEGAITLSLNGHILYSNAWFANLVEQPLHNVLGKPFRDFVTPECQHEFDKVLARAKGEDAKEETVLAIAERKISVLLSFSRLVVDGSPSLSLIITDLSMQKKTEKMLTQKNEELELLIDALAVSNHDLQQFASVASHDLQEPLRKIQIFSQFIKDKSFDQLSTTSQNYLVKIIASSHRMKALIVDILNYSRLSAEEGHFEKTDLNELIDEILEDFELKINERQAEVHVHDLPTVDVNRGQIRQVFQNLISNALKFTPADVVPEIFIEASAAELLDLPIAMKDRALYTCISVRDNGIGFDEKYASSIFSLFEKLNPKSEYEGSGIGLAIAKKIIEKHHGFITATDLGGEGAKFSVILPFKQNPT